MPPVLENLVRDQQYEDRLEDERGYAKFIWHVRCNHDSKVEKISPTQELVSDANSTANPTVAPR